MVVAKNYSRNLLVTVGTTSFDQLIDAILNEIVLKSLLKAGYMNIRLQIGSAPEYIKAKARLASSTLSHITIEVFDYKPSLESDIEWADLVIGHAGAGTILDVLRGPVSGKGKLDRPALLIVSNDTLMNQHQSELVDILGNMRICAACSLGEFVMSPDEWIETATQSSYELQQPNSEQLNRDLRELLSR